MTIYERFWSRVRIGAGPEDCWSWLGGKDRDGYGKFRKCGRAHRFSWSLKAGQPVPAGLWVLHRCDNPSCVNPAHLYVGTARDNCRDRDSRGRSGRCPGELNGARRHPEKIKRGEQHYKAVLTDAEVAQLRALHSTGRFFQRELAAMFRCKRQTVSKIVRGESRAGHRISTVEHADHAVYSLAEGRDECGYCGSQLCGGSCQLGGT